MRVKELLKKAGKALPYVLAGMTVESYFRGLAIDSNTKLLNEELMKNRELRVMLMNNMETQVKNDNIMRKISENAEKVRSSVDQANNKLAEVQDIKSKISNVSEELSKIDCEVLDSKMDSELINANNLMVQTNEHIKILLEIIKGSGGESSSNFISNINNLFKYIQELNISYQSWLDTIPVYHQGAIIHICFSISMLFCLMSLIGIFLGEQLLDYFKLEEKYPSLARFIKLRRKFYRYYFIMNSLFMLSSLLIIIFVNIFVLLH